MSINDFLRLLGKYKYFISIYFAALPLLAFIIGFIDKRQRVIDYIYSILIYLSAIPGMISATLIFYTMFIVKRNLLNVNLFIYFLPVISMALVFYIISRKVKFDDLPGFNRLSGLMLMIGLASIVTLFLYRLRFFIGFFASIETLLIAGVVIFILFKVSFAKISGKKKKF
ncbi:MAG: hypothetical protein GY714_29760 [Desulfobacterales bacterium]|nr:hypothetical protein [Desulfobacterales bacterium]MCP4158711.1 hypothetical protein [Deltaproteobacteria bacterium]